MSTNNPQSPAQTAIITAADRTIKNLQAVIAATVKATGDLAPLADQAGTLAADIQQKESELAALDAKYSMHERTLAAGLKIRVMEDENDVLDTLLSARNLAKISVVDLSDLRDKLTAAISGTEAAVDAAIKNTTASLSAQHNAIINNLKSSHQVDSATTAARVTALEDRNAFLVAEVASLRQQVDAERQTRLEIARAEAGRQGVVVNAGKQ